MAHWITDSDGMFSARVKPWHGLGTILPDVATAQEALQAARLDWTVKKYPVQYTDSEGKLQTVPRQYVVSREDIKSPLGVVGEEYVPLQNTEAFAFFDKVVQDPNGPKYETAGSLHGGKKVWILAKLPSFIEVTEHDIVQEYLLLSNTHDGSRKIEMLWTPIRAVCQNTLSMALGSNVSKVRMKHTEGFKNKFDEVRSLLGIADQNHKILQNDIDVMLSHTITNNDVDMLLPKLFKPVREERGTSHQIETVRAKVLSLFHDGQANTLDGIEGTGWAFYNAITEYCDHARPSSDRVLNGEDRRVESNWFGRSAMFKQKAYDTLLEVCNK